MLLIHALLLHVCSLSLFVSVSVMCVLFVLRYMHMIHSKYIYQGCVWLGGKTEMKLSLIRVRGLIR
jgi:hypothetical protein